MDLAKQPFEVYHISQHLTFGNSALQRGLIKHIDQKQVTTLIVMVKLLT